MAENNEQDQFRCCFLNWMERQEHELEELTEAYNQHPEDNERLNLLRETILRNFRDYQNQRNHLVVYHPPSFFSPSWCSSLENSFLWIAGCRPTLGIRLLYAINGSKLEAQLDEVLQSESGGQLGWLSSSQLDMINELHLKTINKEDNLSTRMASMQEDVADQLAVIAYALDTVLYQSSQQVDRIIDGHLLALASIMEEADKLRVDTMKELIDILTPLQAVDLLLATKKLRLLIHHWGKNIDRQHGKT